jgi:hypothetical protein
MSVSSDFRDLLFELTAEGTRFLIVGAYAVIHHTEPRYTKDLDVWIDRTRANARRVHQALERFGAPLDNLTVEDLTQPEIVFQIGIEPVRVDILTSIEGLTFTSAYRRAVAGKYADVPVKILSLEDVLRAKRAAGRPQDLLDAEKLERTLASEERGARRRAGVRRAPRRKS